MRSVLRIAVESAPGIAIRIMVAERTVKKLSNIVRVIDKELTQLVVG
jgi:hypothetical protein